MPSCRAPTSAGSTSRASGQSDVGVAAHISAASPGGPRYDSNQSEAERRGVENGIWLCQTDAKKIDDDEHRYTRELLFGWREAAERAASDELGVPQHAHSITRRRLVSHRRTLADPSRLPGDLHEFLCDVGAPNAWLVAYEPARRALYEIALNAFLHGKTAFVEIESEPTTVIIRDQGIAFGLTQLRHSGRGGKRAVEDLDRFLSGIFSLRYSRSGDCNQWTLVDEVLAGGAGTPCAIAPTEVPPRMFHEARAEIRKLEACQELHIYPHPFWSYSEWYGLLGAIYNFIGERHVVIHLLDAEDPMAKMLTEELDSVSFPG